MTVAVPLDELAQVLALTLRVALLSTAIGSAVGVPLGLALAARGAGPLRTVVYAFYGLPPVVAGLLLYLLLSRAGPLGFLDLLFTPTAIVLAEVLITTPIVAGLTVAAVAEVPASVREAVRAAGASPARERWTLLSEARYGVLAGVMVALGRALAEVAAALVVGGNIRGETRTLGTAVVQEVAQGSFENALALGGILLAVALLAFAALHALQARARREGPS